MFKITGRNQINLSSIADNKANIMISVNAIILSVIVGTFSGQIEDNPHLIFPILLILLTNVITIIFAVLSTRPNISKGKFTKKDIEEKKTNLMFFGNFYNMELKDYQWGIDKIMKDEGYLYDTMIKDQFFLGKVLGKKYHLLRITYNIFMFGLIFSVLSFAIFFLVYAN